MFVSEAFEPSLGAFQTLFLFDAKMAGQRMVYSLKNYAEAIIYIKPDTSQVVDSNGTIVDGEAIFFAKVRAEFSFHGQRDHHFEETKSLKMSETCLSNNMSMY